MMKLTMPNSPEMLFLLDDLVLFEHGDPGSRPFGQSTNSYAVLKDNKALLVDATFDYLTPPIRRLAEEGYRTIGMVLLHRHVLVGNDQMLSELFNLFGDIPIYLHPLDAAFEPGATGTIVGHPVENVSPRQAAQGITFHDPMNDQFLATFGVEAVHFPGHTLGSIMLYRHDGLLLTGDAAMSTTAKQAAMGMERLVRGPAAFNIDDTMLQNNWLGFNRPVKHVAPYHGRSTYLCRSTEEMHTIMAPLLREEPTVGVEG